MIGLEVFMKITNQELWAKLEYCLAHYDKVFVNGEEIKDLDTYMSGKTITDIKWEDIIVKTNHMRIVGE